MQGAIRVFLGSLFVWLNLVWQPPVLAFSDTSSPVCALHWIRPIQDDANNRPDRFYPYGSTGQGRYQVHHGVEFENPIGTPVVAVASATVVVAGSDEEVVWGRHRAYYGQLIVLEMDERCDGRPVYALYGHLGALYVHLGEHVEQGQVIGQVGMSGIAVGPHLHFEVRVGSNAFDRTCNPELWLAPLPGHGLLVGRVADENQNLLEGVLITVHQAVRPEQYWREAWTYAAMRAEQLNSDVRWGENWVLGDVPAGDYLVRLRVNDRLYTRQVRVNEGQATWVEWSIPVHNLPKRGAKGIMLTP